MARTGPPRPPGNAPPPSGKNFTLTTVEGGDSKNRVSVEREQPFGKMTGRERTLANLEAKKIPPEKKAPVPRFAAKEALPVKPKIRETLLEDMIEYYKRPNGKLIDKFRETCAQHSINFDQMFSKAKAIHIKTKAEQSKKNPMNIEDIYMKRVENGMKLVAGLFALPQVPPYATSVLAAARYGKWRILEALVSNSEHDESAEGPRSALINEIESETGRSALHFLAYAGETDMIQMLAATDLLKLNLLDARDRTCMHYAAIKGDSSLINCLFMLYK